MPLEINMQVNIVIYSFIAGIITGILFDIYRIFRGMNKIKVITIIEDLLFWSLSSLIIFTFFIIYELCFFNSVRICIYGNFTGNISKVF